MKGMFRPMACYPHMIIPISIVSVLYAVSLPRYLTNLSITVHALEYNVAYIRIADYRNDMCKFSVIIAISIFRLLLCSTMAYCRLELSDHTCTPARPSGPSPGPGPNSRISIHFFSLSFTRTVYV